MSTTTATAAAKSHKDKKTLLVMDLIGTILFTDDATRMAAQKVVGREMLRKDVRNLPKVTKGQIYDLVATEFAIYVQPNEATIRVMRDNTAKMQIIILTADLDIPEVRKGLTRILKKYLVPYDQLIMRKPERRNTPDEKWKVAQIKALIKKYSQISIYEDKIDNIAYFMSRLGPNVNYFYVTNEGIKEIN
ncbi:MAG: hypothetical protein ABR981_04080 [Candidatus Micrarchaeaceae archaeon]|jgi:hypothetical protein